MSYGVGFLPRVPDKPDEPMPDGTVVALYQRTHVGTIQNGIAVFDGVTAEDVVVKVCLPDGTQPIASTLTPSRNVNIVLGGPAGDTDISLPFPHAFSPRPRVPTREEACTIRMSFQGLFIPELAHYNNGLPLGWFDAALFCLPKDEREIVYHAKRLHGDTHAIIEYDDAPESVYNEAGQPYQPMLTAGFGANPSAFRSAVLEVLNAGFIPHVFLNGDDGERGYLIAQPELVDVVRVLGADDLMPYVVISPGYDGVFYGWTPGEIASFGQLFRMLCPNGYLSIEHQPGRIPVGNGPEDWTTGGPMQAYDVLLSEFADGALEQDSTWQVAGRTLGPAYRRPTNQVGDPHPPFYFHDGTPRGPYVSIAFEYFTYETVRNRVTAAQVQTDREYLRSLGYEHVC